MAITWVKRSSQSKIAVREANTPLEIFLLCNHQSLSSKKRIEVERLRLPLFLRPASQLTLLMACVRVINYPKH